MVPSIRDTIGVAVTNILNEFLTSIDLFWLKEPISLTGLLGFILFNCH